MAVPTQVQCRLFHFKKQLLTLAALKVMSVVMVCKMFAVSRNTYYKYRQLDEAGKLDYFNCAPKHHGLAKGQPIVEAVLRMRQAYPLYGKKRLAQLLTSEGVKISANTVQRILKAHNQALPIEERRRRHYKTFEATAPNVIWSIDICYIYTAKQDGFELYLITILDDHSRFVVGSGLFTQQTTAEVALVLKQAITEHGIPNMLVCDNGKQFTCSEFQRICRQIGMELTFAPKHYPQYKGKLERFFRTTRQEMPRANSIQQALEFHNQWIASYNYSRTHSSVIDLCGLVHPPYFRFNWKPSRAKAVADSIDIDRVFQVNLPQQGAVTRRLKADHCISYHKQSYHFPQLNKGDLVEILERNQQTLFFYQDQLLLSIPKVAPMRTLGLRIVKAGGFILFHRLRISLSLPKDSIVSIFSIGDDLLFFHNGHQVLPIEGQLSVQ